MWKIAASLDWSAMTAILAVFFACWKYRTALAMSAGLIVLGESPMVIGLSIIGLFTPVVPCWTFTPP